MSQILKKNRRELGDEEEKQENQNSSKHIRKERSYSNRRKIFSKERATINRLLSPPKREYHLIITDNERFIDVSEIQKKPLENK